MAAVDLEHAIQTVMTGTTPRLEAGDNAGASHGMHASVLVVESDSGERLHTAKVLEAAGYRVQAASSFAEAKHVLATSPVRVLLTGVRLGAYNGLHLIVRSRVEHPDMVAILTNHLLDPVLKAEAERQGALYFPRPWTDQALLEVVAHLLEHDTGSSASQKASN